MSIIGQAAGQLACKPTAHDELKQILALSADEPQEEDEPRKMTNHRKICPGNVWLRWWENCPSLNMAIVLDNNSPVE
jgi:hypothetical protein